MAAVILEREFRAGAVSLPSPPPTPGAERRLGLGRRALGGLVVQAITRSSRGWGEAAAW